MPWVKTWQLHVWSYTYLWWGLTYAVTLSCLTVLVQQLTVTCCCVWFVCHDISNVLFAQAYHTTIKHLPRRLIFCTQTRPLNVLHSSQPTIYGRFPLTKYPQIKPSLKPQSYVITSFDFPANTLTKLFSSWRFKQPNLVKCGSQWVVNPCTVNN